jgi:hypothetical protein
MLDESEATFAKSLIVRRKAKNPHWKLCEKVQTRTSLLSIRRLITAWIIAWLVLHNRS